MFCICCPLLIIHIKAKFMNLHAVKALYGYFSPVSSFQPLAVYVLFRQITCCFLIKLYARLGMKERRFVRKEMDNRIACSVFTVMNTKSSTHLMYHKTPQITSHCGDSHNTRHIPHRNTHAHGTHTYSNRERKKKWENVGHA